MKQLRDELTEARRLLKLARPYVDIQSVNDNADIARTASITLDAIDQALSRKQE
jgi:hypothetical protein